MTEPKDQPAISPNELVISCFLPAREYAVQGGYSRVMSQSRLLYGSNHIALR